MKSCGTQCQSKLDISYARAPHFPSPEITGGLLKMLSAVQPRYVSSWSSYKGTVYLHRANSLKHMTRQLGTSCKTINEGPSENCNIALKRPASRCKYRSTKKCTFNGYLADGPLSYAGTKHNCLVMGYPDHGGTCSIS